MKKILIFAVLILTVSACLTSCAEANKTPSAVSGKSENNESEVLHFSSEESSTESEADISRGEESMDLSLNENSNSEVSEESGESIVSEDTSSGDTERVPEELPVVDIKITGQHWMDAFRAKFDTLEELVSYIRSGEDRGTDSLHYAEVVFRNDGYILVPENSEYDTIEEKGYAIHPVTLRRDIGIVHRFDNPFTDYDEEPQEGYIEVRIGRLVAEESNFDRLEGAPYPTSLDGMTMSEYLIERRRLEYVPEDEVYETNNPNFTGKIYRSIGPWYSDYYVAIDETHFLYLSAYQTDVEDVLKFLESLTVKKIPLFEE